VKILFLAPQPFYEERGTPIAVDMMLRGLSERGEKVDVLTYPLGKDIDYPGIKVFRTRGLPFIKQVPPGFSWSKVILDIFMLFQVFPLVLRGRYQYVHAVEESVFIALLIKIIFKIPYLYDMDSSLAQQMVEKNPRLIAPFSSILNFFERLAIRHAKAVVPVCDALYRDIARFQPGKVVILRDVSLLGPPEKTVSEDLRSELGIRGPMMMYVGNLESYQGIDLLLESFALTLKRSPDTSLIVIGGKQADIEKYQDAAQQLGIAAQVHFLGPKPVKTLSSYLSQADVLVSPRIKGNNTPMKIYSYLDSGRALVATNLPTHTQVLTPRVALLAEPTPQVFSAGVLRLLEDRSLRQYLGRNGKKLVREKHTLEVFKNSLNLLYDWLDAEEKEANQQGDLELQAQRKR
jgi:glycosyltransferase involved in cell wall biosynthesis